MRCWPPGIRCRASKVPAWRLSDDQLRMTWQVVSLLLDYPLVKLFQNLTRFRDATGRLPAPVGEPPIGAIGHLGEQGLEAPQRAYVGTFDHIRKCALHLTYYTHGDGRKRGVVLVQFEQAYHHAGMKASDEEPPDHLPVVLEPGALSGLDIIWDLANRHHAGVELLVMAPEHRGSPWHGVLAALHITLPAIDGGQAETVAKLLRDGSETEDIGLESYDIGPSLNPRPDENAELLGI